MEPKTFPLALRKLCSGQEGATIDCDEGVPITPFNLDEEMQEGHFDSEGNYFIKKDQEIRDNWLDNIDWVMRVDDTAAPVNCLSGAKQHQCFAASRR